MKDLKHLLYFENLLQEAHNDLIAQAQNEGKICVAYACENTVMVHISRIREKLEVNPKKPEYLKVVWGIGYVLEAP